MVAEWAEGIHARGDGVILRWQEEWQGAGWAAAEESVVTQSSAGLPVDAAHRELFESRDVIDADGIRPRSFAIPGLGCSRDWTPEASAAAREAGYEAIYAYTVSKGPPGTVPGRPSSGPTAIIASALRGAFNRW